MDKDRDAYIKNFFNKWAALYDFVDIFISNLRIKTVDFTNAGNDSRILDVCTGTGKQAFAFAQRGYDVTGIDFSESILEVAKKKNQYSMVKFELMDATDMSFKDNYFDVACISLALHDMPLAVREKVLHEIVRVTKPKGTIVVIDYALPKNKIIGFLVYHFVKFYERKYYREFVGCALKGLLVKSGIEIDNEFSMFLGAVKGLKGINNKAD